ncbi:MAG: leucine-rich repeat domain-containing protein [Pirellulales bacterium]
MEEQSAESTASAPEVIPPPPSCRWYQFSVRTLLLSITAISIALAIQVAFVVVPARKYREAIAWVDRLGGRKHFVYLRPPLYSRNLTILDLSHTEVTDDALFHLDALRYMSFLDLNHTPVNGVGLRSCDQPSLTGLDLDHTNVDDRGLAHLPSSVGLTFLDLSHTKITDAGLAHLADFGELRCLDLNGTAITDSGVRHLKALASIQALDLGDTGVTEAGIAALKAALPNCRINGP